VLKILQKYLLVICLRKTCQAEKQPPNSSFLNLVHLCGENKQHRCLTTLKTIQDVMVLSCISAQQQRLLVAGDVH
jgi:hypothetical protein